MRVPLMMPCLMRSSWVGLRMRKLRSLARIPIKLRPRSATASPTRLMPPSDMLRPPPATCQSLLALIRLYTIPHTCNMPTLLALVCLFTIPHINNTGQMCVYVCSLLLFSVMYPLTLQRKCVYMYISLCKCDLVLTPKQQEKV